MIHSTSTDAGLASQSIATDRERSVLGNLSEDTGFFSKVVVFAVETSFRYRCFQRVRVIVIILIMIIIIITITVIVISVCIYIDIYIYIYLSIYIYM